MQAYVRHPELAAARSNRDYAYKQVCDAVNAISDVAQASGQSYAHPYEGPGELAAALDELDVSFSSNCERKFILLSLDTRNWSVKHLDCKIPLII